jgi:hypothetical protein
MTEDDVEQRVATTWARPSYVSLRHFATVAMALKSRRVVGALRRAAANSNYFRSWHFADMPVSPSNVCYRGDCVAKVAKRAL